MYGGGLRTLRNIDKLFNDQITFARWRPADRIRLVGHSDVESATVGLGIHGYGGNSHLAARPDDAHRNFTAIGDQDLAEHILTISPASAWTMAWRVRTRGPPAALSFHRTPVRRSPCRSASRLR